MVQAFYMRTRKIDLLDITCSHIQKRRYEAARGIGPLEFQFSIVS